jgi:hypothetical protein
VPPNSSYDACSTSRYMAIISKTPSWLLRGRSRVSSRNPLVGSEPLRATKVRDEVTQRVVIEGTQYPQASYLSLDREVSLTSLRVGWYLVIRVFSIGITRERRLKPPGLDLMGGISLCLILWRGVYPGWLAPVNGDTCSTQILTRHYGAKSQTVSQLVNLGTVPTRQVPIVQPLWVIKTPTDGITAEAAPPSDKADGTVEHHYVVSAKQSITYGT